MKAAYIEQYGDADVIQLRELPSPSLAPGGVIVDVHAASVNAADYKVRSGLIHAEDRLPLVLGRDFSGVVAEVAGDVDDLRVGEAVFGVLAAGDEGAYTERLSIDASIIAPKPASLTHVEAAASALIGLTASVTLEETLKLAPGEKILIHGGAGGVGGYAVQLASHLGAHVVTTASVANHDYVTELGANEVIDYRAHDFRDQVSDCDAVFDTVGGEVATRSFDVLKTGGRAAFIASGVSAPPAPSPRLTSLRPAVLRSRAPLERIVRRHEAGIIKLPKITSFPFSAVKEAHAISERRHLRGKLVLKIR